MARRTHEREKCPAAGRGRSLGRSLISADPARRAALPVTTRDPGPGGALRRTSERAGGRRRESSPSVSRSRLERRAASRGSLSRRASSGVEGTVARTSSRFSFTGRRPGSSNCSSRLPVAFEQGDRPVDPVQVRRRTGASILLWAVTLSEPAARRHLLREATPCATDSSAAEVRIRGSSRPPGLPWLPNVTETIVALGLTDQFLVGVSDFCILSARRTGGEADWRPRSRA